MPSRERSPAGRSPGTLLRRLFLPTGLGGCSLWLSGCVVLGGVAAGAAAALLTGVFLGSIQASFAATARSYAFTDVGHVQMAFNSPNRHTTNLVRFNGRLPGFHFVIVTNRDKAVRAAAEDEVVFETDVAIDFASSPPTISGTIREEGGSQRFAIEELYPNVTVTQDVGRADDEGRREVTVTIVGRGPDGEELEYTLVLRAHLTSSGNFLDGPVEVTRDFSAPGVEPLAIEGSGELDTRKDPTMDVDDLDVGPENDNADQQTNENSDENVNAGEDDAENVNADEGVDDENGNLNGDDEVPDENDNAGEDDDAEPEETTPPSSCIPGLPAALSGAVDMFIESGGKDELDLDGDGTVTAEEVQEAVNPLIAPFFSVSPDAAACIAELLNE